LTRCHEMVGDGMASGHLSRPMNNIKQQPLVLLRLFPILLVAAAFPFLLAPLVRGPPQVPEPRCA
jgi:hypothetical protein